MTTLPMLLLGGSVAAVGANVRPGSEMWTDAEVLAAGWVPRGNFSLSHDMLPELLDYPDEFSWCNRDGVNYCTISQNQHIPHYCGSCWAFGSLSALADRVKIARGGRGTDIFPSVQHLLNCGNAGSCHGGSGHGTYQWIHQVGGISTATSMPYLACSKESTEGFCPHVDTTCKPENVARTCGSFYEEAGSCVGLAHYPNISVADYGAIKGEKAMMKEIFHRGTIACGIAAHPLLNYETGIMTQVSNEDEIDHVISVVGWGTDPAVGKYWHVRNSWGEFYGEYGYVRVAFGALAIEDNCNWAVVGDYTAPEKKNQVHCWEGGDNCRPKGFAAKVEDVVTTLMM